MAATELHRMGDLAPVQVGERYKEFVHEQLPLYACRVVLKVSSKGKMQPRVLLIAKRGLMLCSLGGKTRRLVLHENIQSAAFQRRTNGVYIQIKPMEGVDEPDLLFTQTGAAEVPPPPIRDGTDILGIIDWCRQAHTGDRLSVQDMTSQKELNAATCNLKKSSKYKPVQAKVLRGDLARPQGQSPAHGPSANPTPDKLSRQNSRDLDAAPCQDPHPGEAHPADRSYGVRSFAGAPRADQEGQPPPAQDAGSDIRRYTVRLNGPGDDIGLDWEGERGPGQRVFIVGVRPHTPAAQAGVVPGVLLKINGYGVDSTAKMVSVTKSLRKTKATTYTFSAIPFEPGAAHKRASVSKLLVVGASYDGSKHELPNAAADAEAVATALFSTGFCTPADARMLLQEAGNPTTPTPTKQNIVNGLKWLVDGVKPGDSLCFCFVGHCMQQTSQPTGPRDGPGEALYPSDFHQSGVIPEGELRRLLVDPLPAGAKLTVICDSCGAGTLLNLPFKLKTTAEGELQSTFAPLPVPEGAVLQLSSWSGPQAKPPAPSPVIATGAIAAGFCAAMAVDPEPSFEDLLGIVRTTVLGKIGMGGQTPQVSCSWQASGNERFTPAARRGGMNPAAPPPSSPRAQAGAVGLQAVPASPGSKPNQVVVAGADDHAWQPGGMEFLASLQQQAFPSALPPDVLLSKVPRSVLSSPGLARLLTVQWQNGVPEIFYAAEIVCIEARPAGAAPAAALARYPSPQEANTVLWPNAKMLFVGREAVYVLDPNGEVDRCIPLQDIHDFILLKGGYSLDQAISNTPGGPRAAAGNPWLAVRVPSQYELLMQPSDKHGEGALEIQSFLQVVNALMQHGHVSLLGTGSPAKVLVVDTDLTPGLLRLQRPQNYSFQWIPLNVRIWPTKPAGPPIKGNFEVLSNVPLTV